MATDFYSVARSSPNVGGAPGGCAGNQGDEKVTNGGQAPGK